MQKIPRKPRLRGVPRIAFAAALTALHDAGVYPPTLHG